MSTVRNPAAPAPAMSAEEEPTAKVDIVRANGPPQPRKGGFDNRVNARRGVGFALFVRGHDGLHRAIEVFVPDGQMQLHALIVTHQRAVPIEQRRSRL